MSSNLRLMVWDRDRKALLYDGHLTPKEGSQIHEFMVGRHPENQVSIQHPSLSPFHFIIRFHSSEAFLVNVPGTPSLKNSLECWLPHKLLQRIKPSVAVQRIPERGLRLFSGTLLFDFMGKASVFRRPWPITPASSIGKGQILPKKRMRFSQVRHLISVSVLTIALILGLKPWKIDPLRKAKRVKTEATRQVNVAKVEAPPSPVSLVQIKRSPPQRFSIFENSKAQFLSGKEGQAIQTMIRIPEGIDLAKQLHAFQKTRQNLSTIDQHSQINPLDFVTSWKNLANREKHTLGDVSSKTRVTGARMLSKFARFTYANQDRKLAYLSFCQALELNPQFKEARHGLDQLNKEAEDNFRRSYLLATSAPDRAKSLPKKLWNSYLQTLPLPLSSSD